MINQTTPPPEQLNYTCLLPLPYLNLKLCPGPEDRLEVPGPVYLFLSPVGINLCLLVSAHGTLEQPAMPTLLGLPKPQLFPGTPVRFLLCCHSWAHKEDCEL